jgi:hypothetical protein
MKFNFNFDYDKLFLKEITILIPKYHNNLVSFLTPILGLYGINIKEFINDFESKTRFINFDVTLPTRVRITKIKTYEIFLNTPYISNILNSLGVQKKSINLLTIYKLVLLKSLLNNTLLVDFFYRSVYKRIRVYLSQFFILSDNLMLSKAKLHNYLFGIINNPNLFVYKRLLKNFKNVNFLTDFKTSKFGAFFVFYNHNASTLNKLFCLAALFSVKVLKVKNKFLSVFVDRNLNFNGNIFFFGSEKFSTFNNFNTSLSISNSSNFYRSFFRFDKNILNTSFFNIFLQSFYTQRNKIINLLQLLRLRIVRLVSYKFLLFFKIMNKIKHANISPNIS